MKHPEEAIERVLAGLRDTEAPAGLERRILSAVENRASRPRQSARVWPVAFGSAFAAIIVAAAVVAIKHRPSPPPAHASKPPIRQASSSTPLVAATQHQSSRFVPHAPAAPAQGNGDSAADSLAMAEMLAPSLPEPPMPLTEQERLLLQMVHAGDPEELASLDSNLQHMLEARDKAEFERFFPTPPPIRQPVTVDTVAPSANEAQPNPDQNSDQPEPAPVDLQPSLADQSSIDQPTTEPSTQQDQTTTSNTDGR
jgi:hypothetical protein